MLEGSLIENSRNKYSPLEYKNERAFIESFVFEVINNDIIFKDLTEIFFGKGCGDLLTSSEKDSFKKMIFFLSKRMLSYFALEGLRDEYLKFKEQIIKIKKDLSEGLINQREYFESVHNIIFSGLLFHDVVHSLVSFIVKLGIVISNKDSRLLLHRWRPNFLSSDIRERINNLDLYKEEYVAVLWTTSGQKDVTPIAIYRQSKNEQDFIENYFREITSILNSINSSYIDELIKDEEERLKLHLEGAKMFYEISTDKDKEVVEMLSFIYKGISSGNKRVLVDLFFAFFKDPINFINRRSL